MWVLLPPGTREREWVSWRRLKPPILSAIPLPSPKMNRRGWIGSWSTWREWLRRDRKGNPRTGSPSSCPRAAQRLSRNVVVLSNSWRGLRHPRRAITHVSIMQSGTWLWCRMKRVLQGDSVRFPRARGKWVSRGTKNLSCAAAPKIISSPTSKKATSEGPRIHPIPKHTTHKSAQLANHNAFQAEF